MSYSRQRLVRYTSGSRSVVFELYVVLFKPSDTIDWNRKRRWTRHFVPHFGLPHFGHGKWQPTQSSCKQSHASTLVSRYRPYESKTLSSSGNSSIIRFFMVRDEFSGSKLSMNLALVINSLLIREAQYDLGALKPLASPKLCWRFWAPEQVQPLPSLVEQLQVLGWLESRWLNAIECWAMVDSMILECDDTECYDYEIYDKRLSQLAVWTELDVLIL